MELKIGNKNNIGAGFVHLTGNEWIGYAGPTSTEIVLTFGVEPEVSGRYLTLQTMVNQVLGIDEIYAKSLE